MGRKPKQNQKPRVHEELNGLNMTINEFGEVVSNISVDELNAFLTKQVPDKKLMNRHDDAYQQEFKAQLAAEGLDTDDDEDLPFYEETQEEEDDAADFLKEK